MSSILRALVGAATVLAVSHAAPLAAQAAPQRFAYVDTKAILDQAPGRAEAEAQLQKEAGAWDAEVKKMQDANIALVTAFQKNFSATMTTAERDRQTKSITDKQAEWQKRNDDINAEADRRKAELLQPILDQVKIALEDVRKAANLDVIFDVAQNATIVAVDKNLNISDRVIARLRLLGAPVITPKADATKSSAPATKPSGLPVSAPSGVGRPATPIKPDSAAVPKKPDSVFSPVE